MDPVSISTGASVFADSVNALKSVLEAVPTGGRQRRAHRDQRMQAYLAFQRAAHEASVWPEWLGLLEQAVLSKDVTTAQTIPELAALRSAISALLGALSEIRLVGNPELRRLAEEIVTLLVELMEARLQGSSPRSLRLGAARRLYAAANRRGGVEVIEERFPRLTGRLDDMKPMLDDDVRKAKADWFNDCQKALGAWHKKFTLAARKDLGNGSRRWHIGKKPRAGWWQVWRPHEEWPGGWPPPEADQLIEQARQEREARTPARAINGTEPSRSQVVLAQPSAEQTPVISAEGSSPPSSA